MDIKRLNHLSLICLTQIVPRMSRGRVMPMNPIHCDCPVKGCVCDQLRSATSDDAQCDDCMVGKHIKLVRKEPFGKWRRIKFEK